MIEYLHSVHFQLIFRRFLLDLKMLLATKERHRRMFGGKRKEMQLVYDYVYVVEDLECVDQNDLCPWKRYL